MNVFKLDKKKEINLIPLYARLQNDRGSNHANLIQIGNKQKPHYVVINNMNRLLFDTNIRLDHKMYICKYCLASFSKEFEPQSARMLMIEQ